MNTSVNGFYSAGIRHSSTQQIKDPEYLKWNTCKEELDNHQYIYFLAEKLNNSGISYNQRFFLLTDNTKFGYCSKFEIKPIPFMDYNNIYKLKREVPVQDVQFLNDKDPAIINVRFTDKQTQKDVVWKIRFYNQSMCKMAMQALLTAYKTRIQDINKPNKVQQIRQSNIERNSTRPVSPMFSNMLQKEQTIIKQQKISEKPNQQQIKQKAIQNQMQHIKISLLDIQSKKLEQQNPEQTRTIKKPKQIEIETSQTDIKQISFTAKMKQREQRNKQMKIPHYKYNYNFLKQGQQHYQIMEFKQEATSLVKKIIDELCLFPNRRVYRPQQTIDDEIWIYKVGGLIIKIGLCSSSVNKQNRVRRYKLAGMGRIYEQFKNYDYILQVTRNKGVLRVPLACLIEYKGFVSLVRVDVAVNSLKKKLVNQLQTFSLQSRVDPSIFQDNQSLILIQNDPIYYQQFSQQQNQESSGHFFRSLSEIYYFTQVKHFLPKDIRYLTDSLNNKILRPELINREEYQDRLFIGEDITKYQKITDQDGLGNQLTLLTEASKDILDIAKELSEELSTLDDLPLDTFDLQNKFHQKGVNMRYVWLVHQATNVNIIRNICHTYALVKTICALLNCKFQQLIRQWMQLSPFKSQSNQQIKQSNFALAQTAALFLNSIIGDNHNNQNIKMLSNHMMQIYGIRFNKNEILHGYLIQGIDDQSGLVIKWPKEKFKKHNYNENILGPLSIQKIDCRIKTYNLSYTSILQEVKQIIQDFETDKSSLIQNILGLRTSGIPNYIKSNPIYNKLLQYLSLYIKPLGLNSSSRMLPSSSIYIVADSMWNHSSYLVRVSQIKWMLMQGNQQKAFQLLSNLINLIRKKCQDNHPAQSQIYTMLSQYYLQNNNLRQAEKYGVQSSQILDKLVLPSHMKKGEINFQLGDIYQKSLNHLSALQHYKLAKSTFQSKSNIANSAYFAELLIKIGQVSLKLNQYKQAIEVIRKAIFIYEETLSQDKTFEDEKTQCYQLLSRLYEITQSQQELTKVAVYCSHALEQISNDNFEKLLKIAIYPIFKSMQKSSARKMLLMINNIVGRNQINQQESMQYLRYFINQSELFENLEMYIKNFDEMFVYITNQDVVDNWNGLQDTQQGDLYDFINLIASIIGIIGVQYIIGILSQNTLKRRSK